MLYSINKCIGVLSFVIVLCFLPNLLKGQCPTTDLVTGSSPYPDSNPVFQQVVDSLPYCCDVTWDADCQSAYNVLIALWSPGGGSTGGSIPSLEIDNNYTATQLIEDIFIGGTCAEVSNITSVGASSQMAYFSNGLAAMGIEDGVILSSGNASQAVGPNSGPATGTDLFFSPSTDPDLPIIGGATSFDAVSIEFDFIPTASEISFEFVFASEEYPEFVNGGYNDAFGFFVSGPGISGPYSNAAENIAVIPGTSIDIAINNINDISNSQYYNDNAGGTGMEYDAYLNVLTAEIEVIPCETYHIKLALCDSGDGSLDSAVFLRSNSFEAGAGISVDMLSSGVVGVPGTVEGCNPGAFVFERESTDDLSQPIVVNFDISGSATNGVDYSVLPNQITIPANATSYELSINAFEDGLVEGPEEIILTVTSNVCSCDNSTYSLILNDAGTALCDDGNCSNGVETWNGCNCVAGTPPLDPGCDDGFCENGTEYWDGCNCIAGTAPVEYNCDDGFCENGLEYWDGCSCQAGAPPIEVNCDDADCTNGLETWNGCNCVAGTPPVDPNCDDGICENGLETWNGCNCVAGIPPVEVNCDDGDCTNGLETWNGCNCVVGTPPVEPNCDDGICENGTETWNGCNCVAGIPPVEVNCDDGDCTNGFETWNGCDCTFTPSTVGCTNETALNYNPAADCDDGSCNFPCPDPGNCDDGLCENGVEYWDGDLCECLSGTTPIEINCDDGICENGLETWNGCECESGTPPTDPNCDDGLCENGLETWNGCECEPGTPPVEVNCDDGICENGVETWNGCECEPGTPPVNPGCDDGDCSNGFESWDGCGCITTPSVLGCTNTTADNYNPIANCDDGSCTFPCPDPGCDDGLCINGVETWDGNLCECLSGPPPTVLICDDGDCTNGEEVWNETLCNCETINIPNSFDCEDDDDCTTEQYYDLDICECITEIVYTDPNPGFGGTYTLCQEEEEISLFSLLDGTPDNDGIWIRDLGDPLLIDVFLADTLLTDIFDPANDLDGSFVYVVQNTHCVASATLNITVEPCEVPIYEALFPTAFSPNGDGINDVFHPILNNVERFDILIYNRWGQLVYSDNSLNPVWDGTYKGEVLPLSVYVYTAKVVFIDGTAKEYQGSFTIVR